MNTVKSCTFQKEWSKDGRTGKIYDVELSDGTKGQAYNDLQPGPEVEVTPGKGNFPPTIKAIKKNGFGGNGFKQQKAGNESFALAYSKDWAIAQLNKGKEVTSKDIIAVAELFYTWLQEKKDK
jgi:hypothetical protein